MVQVDLNQYFLILLPSYIILYFFYSFIKVFFKDKFIDKLIFCPMCASFFTILIIGFILDFHPLIQAFLLGMTTTGIAFKTNEYLKYKGKSYFAQHFILQFILALIGLIIVIFYLAKHL